MTKDINKQNSRLKNYAAKKKNRASSPVKNVAIIGCGVTGLFCGYFLSKKHCKVTIFEKNSSIGGLLSALEIENNQYVDKLYHHIFSQDKELISFLEKAGLTKEISWTDMPTAIIMNKEWYSFNSPGDLFKIANFSLKDKCRLLFFLSRMSFSNNWKKWDKIDIFEMIVGYCGEESWKSIYFPLLRGKFGSKAPHISGAWMHDKIKQRTKCRKNKRGERLATFKNSYKVLINYLSEKILENGGEIFADSQVKKILVSNLQFKGINVNDEILTFDDVIVTIPAPEALNIFPDSLSDECMTIRKLSQIKYMHSLCMILRFKRPLSKYYFTVVADSTAPFSVIIQQVNMANFNGCNEGYIVYLGKYVYSKKDLYAKTDQELFDDYFNYLRISCPSVSEDDIISYEVVRFPYAQPVFEKNFVGIKPHFKTEIEGMYLLSMAQLFPMSRSVNSCLIMVKRFIKQYF